MADNQRSVTLNLGGIGGVVAAFLSYAKWHSVVWAILHFFCGWIYVIYSLCKFGLPHLG